MSSSTFPENEVLSYIVETYRTDPAGGFAFPRVQAFLRSKPEDFVSMFGKLPKGNIKQEKIGAFEFTSSISSTTSRILSPPRTS